MASQTLFVGDKLGTVRQLFNPDTAAPTRQDRDAWGRATNPIPATSSMGFAGRVPFG